MKDLVEQWGQAPVRYACMGDAPVPNIGTVLETMPDAGDLVNLFHVAYQMVSRGQALVSEDFSANGTTRCSRWLYWTQVNTSSGAVGGLVFSAELTRNDSGQGVWRYTLCVHGDAQVRGLLETGELCLRDGARVDCRSAVEEVVEDDSDQVLRFTVEVPVGFVMTRYTLSFESLPEAE